jgi:hypothetical protein
MRAKMLCTSVTDYGPSNEQVTLQAVYSSDKNSENYAWSQASPSASVNISISNPGARGHFRPGKEYFVDFFEAPAPEVKPA